MKVSAYCRVAAGAALLLAGTATFAKDGIRSSDALPPPAPQSSQASDKSQGLPNANGEKPGKGVGEGHLKDRGRGHEIGRGHGHDSDRNDSPG